MKLSHEGLTQPERRMVRPKLGAFAATVLVAGLASNCMNGGKEIGHEPPNVETASIASSLKTDADSCPRIFNSKSMEVVRGKIEREVSASLEGKHVKADSFVDVNFSIGVDRSGWPKVDSTSVLYESGGKTASLDTEKMMRAADRGLEGVYLGYDPQRTDCFENLVVRLRR